MIEVKRFAHHRGKRKARNFRNKVFGLFLFSCLSLSAFFLSLSRCLFLSFELFSFLWPIFKIFFSCLFFNFEDFLCHLLQLFIVKLIKNFNDLLFAGC